MQWPGTQGSASGLVGVRLEQVARHADFSFTELELVSLEDEAFAVSAQAGLVIHVNALGRCVLESLRTGVTLNQFSRTMAAECAISPARARDDLACFADSIKLGFERASACEPVHAGLAPPLEKETSRATYLVFGRRMCVHYPNQQVAAICHPPPPPLAPFQVDGASPDKLDVVIHEAEDEVSVRCGSTKVSIANTRGALMTALQRVMLCHGEPNPSLFDVVVHAGSIVGGGGAWLIGGASGRGKSTLVTRLDAGGLRVLSDDLTPIDILTGRALPLPIAMSVKEGGWPTVAKFRNDLFAVRPRRSQTGKHVKYLKPLNPATDEDRHGHPIAGLLLPRYEPGAMPQIQPVSLKEAMVPLCDRFGRFPIEPSNLRRTIDLLEPVPRYRLTYGDIGEILPELMELL